MNLTSLGFNAWFEEQSRECLQPQYRLARVTAVDRDAFRIRNEEGDFPAELSGRFRFLIESAEELPCVGDWVCAQMSGTAGPSLIHAVLPRRTFLRRKCSGKTTDFQMIAANLDAVLIVQSCDYDFNLHRLERYLTIAYEGGIVPVIVLTKTDLIPPEERVRLETQIESLENSPTIFSISNVTGAGLDSIYSLLEPGKTFCLLGSSGVGKTTLINRLIGREEQETKAVSATGEGVHTTTRRQLLMLEQGAMLIDTPGMRELGLVGVDEGLRETFSEIAELSHACRFSNCTHTSEPGCAVLAAVENGTLNKDRHDHYLKLKKENEFQNLSYAGRRKKDKDFGRFIKSAHKQIKKSK